ncbi:MAG: FABP family protein [Rhodanobacter sp.]|nr:MAG: FABP family protein [Rhodanobacter sp.]TAM12042.1 MAG: FABP family protein [Rhodanobacter sp.]TAM34617.1 MAG: FABP family protein [Rhodanobacter sp.]
MAKILGPQRLGPLTPLVGDWEGNVGVDLSYHNDDDETAQTSYFEKAWFHPIPVTKNGKQSLEGLNYKMTAWRHGEEAMDPFHDEVGYLLWEPATKQVMRVVVFGRGIAMIAGGTAKPRDKSLRFKATPGDPNYGILQNKYLSERAELKGFDCTFKFNEDGTLHYAQTLVLKLAALGGKEMKHTDENTLHLVNRLHPSEEA